MVALQAEIVLEAIRAAPASVGDMETALRDTVSRLTPIVAEALGRLAVEDPDAFLKHYANLLEFKTPKLARIEHKVEGQIDQRHFVAVEHREAGPKLIEAEVREERG